jgi:hypothetical protein
MAEMLNTFRVLNTLVDRGVIDGYAIGGAVAALNYIEPTLTDDLDVLISMEGFASGAPSGLIDLGPIYEHLRKAGYAEFRKEGVVVEGWPVQFLPVADALDSEGLSEAVPIEIPGTGEPGIIRIWVLRPEHVVATALRLSRPKDRIRISQFLEEGAVDPVKLRGVLERHGLRAKWAEFCRTTGTEDPLGLG